MLSAHYKASHQSNRQGVQSRIGEKQRKVLFRTGSYGRRVFINTFPRRKGPSPTGRPPHAHAPGGSGLKDVRFAISNDKLAIGHSRYTRRRRVRPIGKTVTQILDEGGAAIVQPINRPDVFQVHFRPRPFRVRVADQIDNFLAAQWAQVRV